MGGSIGKYLILLLQIANYQRRNDPLSVLGSIGALPPFHIYSSKSSDSSPALSDDYMYSPDELRRLSRSTVSSTDTISPKDSVLFSSDLSESVGYYSQSTARFNTSPASYETPGPMSPISPRPIVPTPRVRVDVKPPKDGDTAQAGPSRRRSSKVTPANSNNAAKSSAVSNHNNSKPMTARDRKRRQMHNASAMRSRIRLNETLDKMWKTIPLSRRRRGLSSITSDTCDSHNDAMEEFDDDEEERIGRADKVEVGIDYIIYLEERVKELEETIGRSH